ncbi:tyrosinase central domain protein [Seiridium cupressi]
MQPRDCHQAIRIVCIVQVTCLLNCKYIANEWDGGDLSAQDRKGYTDAVLCLQDLPPRSDPAGARSRFDDFIAYWNWGRPVFAGLPDVPSNPQTDGLGYSPRCLKRDVSVHAARETTTNYTENLIAHSNNVYWFQTIMNGRAEIGEWGVHTAGQFTIGGDPGGDFFVAPGDPAFFLHDAQIDRVYWIW